MIQMDFNFPDETIAVRNMVREFSSKEIEPLSRKIDLEKYFPVEVFKKMGKLGILGITIPEEYGGAGMDYLTQGIALEEISYYSASVGLSFGAHSNLVTDNIYRNGNEEQREKFVTPLVSGNKIGSLCLTEPGAGSDALGGMRTTYRREGDLFVINGLKTFITNAPVSDFFDLCQGGQIVLCIHSNQGGRG